MMPIKTYHKREPSNKFMHFKSDVITLLRQLSEERMVLNTWGVYAKRDARPLPHIICKNQLKAYENA